MKRISLKQRLALLSHLVLHFTNLRTKKTQEGTTLVTLELAEPIEAVKGSQTFEDPQNPGKRLPYSQYDVTEVHVHESVISEFEDQFEIDEDGFTGKYEGDDLFLDVSKSTLEVFLVKDSFASMGNTMRNNGRSDRVNEIIKRASERIANKTGAPVGSKQPVDAE